MKSEIDVKRGSMVQWLHVRIYEGAENKPQQCFHFTVCPPLPYSDFTPQFLLPLPPFCWFICSSSIPSSSVFGYFPSSLISPPSLTLYSLLPQQQTAVPAISVLDLVCSSCK